MVAAVGASPDRPSMRKLAHLAYLATASGRLLWGMQNPRLALSGIAQMVDEARPPPFDFVAGLTNDSDVDIGAFYGRLRRRRFEAELQEIESETGFQAGVHNCVRLREMVYCLVRSLKPDVFLETGVHHGLSSAYILQGLADNGGGRLVSIDFRLPRRQLPDGVSYDWPPGRGSGWIIPERLRGGWTLVEGRSVEKLRPVLSDLDRVDVFLHDSEHTYENMMFEFRSVWPHLTKGGILLSDDILLTDAFLDFAREAGVEHSIFLHRVGGLRKPDALHHE
jgi:predicted O-methyltransferase YrrM